MISGSGATGALVHSWHHFRRSPVSRRWRAPGKAVVEAGHDPREFVLSAFGGAGPAHCARYAAGVGANPTAMPDHVVDVYVEALRRPGALHANFQYYRALDVTISQNRERAQEPLTMPVPAVGGAASRGVGVAADVRRAARNATEVVLPDCGHYVAEEAPEPFTSAVLSFLRGGTAG